jgi:hypothetical protein
LTQSGVLVIRVWLEEGAEAPLRARITRQVDASEREPRESAASSEEEILDVVAGWLQAFRPAAAG